jgi:exosome complex component RRP41
MRDLVAGCSSGIIDGQVVLDLDDAEDKEGSGDMPVALMPNLNQVTLLQIDGMYTRENFQKAFELAIEGSRKVYELQRKALTDRFFASGQVELSNEDESGSRGEE